MVVFIRTFAMENSSTKFVSIMAFRQQHLQPGAFGRSDIFFVCRLRPLTFELSPCITEVKECIWMNLARLCEEMQRSMFTKRLADLARFGLEEGYESADIMSQEMESIHRGLKYNMHHRPLPEKYEL